MAVRPEEKSEAQLACGPQIDLLEVPLDDSWARDIGPTFVVNGKGKLAGVSWRFNAWGNKYHPFTRDAEFASQVLKGLDLPNYVAPLVCEGGAIHSDGEGTLLTTEQTLLNENRNPELNRQQIEERLALFTGSLRIIWLGDGFSDKETDGHIDNIACFAAPARVILGVHDDKSHPNYRPALESLMRLQQARDATGRQFEIVELKQPRQVRERFDGSLLETSYVNFYLCNGAVIAPSFGDENDAAAHDVLKAAFPGREIVTVEALDVVNGGGGIHCITQQQPEGSDE
jgi:agmatine deiminase